MRMTNAILLATMLAAMPAQAKVNVLLGMGIASGNICLKSPVADSDKPSTKDFARHWLEQLVAGALTFQIEHQFANLVYGLHVHFSAAFNEALIFSPALFFGGKIHSFTDWTLYLNGGLGYGTYLSNNL